MTLSQAGTTSLSAIDSKKNQLAAVQPGQNIDTFLTAHMNIGNTLPKRSIATIPPTNNMKTTNQVEPTSIADDNTFVKFLLSGHGAIMPRQSADSIPKIGNIDASQRKRVSPYQSIISAKTEKQEVFKKCVVGYFVSFF